MFLSRRKPKEAEEDLTSLPDDVKKKKQNETATEEEEGLVNQIASLEDMVNKRTRDLEQAKYQLRGLSRSQNTPAGEDDLRTEAEIKAEQLLTEPNKLPLEEPSIVAADHDEEQEENQEQEQDKQTATLSEKENEDKVEVAAASTAGEAPGDASDDFFNEEEEEDNRLAGLIAALPDVTIDELLSEAAEVKSLVQEWVKDEGD
ncbi:hypothetical protein ACFLV1_02100 [Chloroflexota bacterium]